MLKFCSQDAKLRIIEADLRANIKLGTINTQGLSEEQIRKIIAIFAKNLTLQNSDV